MTTPPVLLAAEVKVKAWYVVHRAAIILSVASLIAGFLLGRW